MRLATSPGVSVTVCVGGIPLEEYDDPDASNNDHPLKGVKYVEAVPGANFVVRLSSTQLQLGGCASDQVLFTIYMDGKRVLGRVLPVNTMAFFTYDAKGVVKQSQSRFVTEKFAFTALNTVDGAIRDLKPSDFKALGEIKVECTLVRPTGALTAGRSDDGALTLSPRDKVLPEKVLKGRAISNRVSLSGGEPCVNPPIGVSVAYPYGTAPFVTCVFKYRSRGDLQIEHIIPRDPTPVPLEERDEQSLTLEEARELLRRNRERVAEQAHIKEEKVKVKNEKRKRAAIDDDDDEVVIINESQPKKRARMSADSAVEIVDLTDA